MVKEPEVFVLLVCDFVYLKTKIKYFEKIQKMQF